MPENLTQEQINAMMNGENINKDGKTVIKGGNNVLKCIHCGATITCAYESTSTKTIKSDKTITGLLISNKMSQKSTNEVLRKRCTSKHGHSFFPKENN